jgi:PI-3-kinase-related kinase SMG-1
LCKPERVPFRLTQNLEHALGLSGPEGVFRLTCENVLKTLKQGRETLLTLLEAFVYDPILDRTSNDTGIIASFYGGSTTPTTKQDKSLKQQSKRLMEKKHTLRLYKIRLAENRLALKSNEEALTQLLLKIESLFQFIMVLNQKRDHKEILIKQHEQAKIYLDECLTLQTTKATNSNQHLVYSLHDRYMRYIIYTQQRDCLFAKLNDLSKTFHLMTSQFNQSIHFIRNYSEPLVSSLSPTLSPYLLTIDFFQSTSQSNHTVQCEQLQKELDQLKSDQTSLLKQINEELLSKSKLFQYLPSDYPQRFQFKQCIQWLDEINDSFLDSSSKLIETIHHIYPLYRIKFNKLFKLKSLKSQSIEKKQQQKQQLDTKLTNFKYELDETVKKEELCLSRKVNLIEMNETDEFEIFNFIQFEMNQNSGYQLLVDMQLYESLSIIVLQFLYDNLQKWIQMENASLKAKDQLVGLTSADGDWFLEEMYSLLANCNNLTCLIEKIFNKFNLLNNDETTNNANEWFIQLLDANVCFKTLFELLKQLIFEYDTNWCRLLVELTFWDVSNVQFVIEQFNAMHIEEFFELILVDTFSIENFNQ